MPLVSHLSVKNKQGEQDVIQSPKEGIVSPKDAVVHLTDIDHMQCDVEEVAKTPKGTQSTFPSGRVDTAVQTDIDSETAGHVHRDLHMRRYRRSLSPSTYYKNSVSVHDFIQV